MAAAAARLNGNGIANGNGDRHSNGNGNGNGNGRGLGGNGQGHENGWHGRVLVTAHRRESWGAGMDEIAAGLTIAARQFPHRQFLVPLHPNPLVRRSFDKRFPANVAVVDPLPYTDFVKALASSELVVTDSGGVLEEATCLGIPTLVVRQRTERPEAVDIGLATVVGLERDHVASAIVSALLSPVAMAVPIRNSVFGDGRAGERIVAWLRWRARLTRRRPKPFRAPRPMPRLASLERTGLEWISP
jgi:UDP-N-acetylglucosamine 2-epimerase (non-hydrolysing)